jgi:uncharacterized protein (TIGR03435 family)
LSTRPRCRRKTKQHLGVRAKGLAIAGPLRIALLLFAVLIPTAALRSYAAQASTAVQTTRRPTFDVASVKPTADFNAERGGGFGSGGRFVMTNVDVRTLVRIAYRSGPVLFPSQIIGGPSWTGSQRYDVTARAGSELATLPADQLARLQPLLLQSLLEDRFKLKAHRETRNLPRYALILARKDGTLGPQLRRSSSDCGVDVSACATTARPGLYSSGGTPISSLSNYLASAVVQQVVVDRTGLTGRFAIHLEWAPDLSGTGRGDTAIQSVDTTSIFTALQEQLGLKLESERGPVDVVVIDHVERPTAN